MCIATDPLAHPKTVIPFCLDQVYERHTAALVRSGPNWPTQRDDSLDGGEVVPGFSVKLSELFAVLNR